MSPNSISAFSAARTNGATGKAQRASLPTCRPTHRRAKAGPSQGYKGTGPATQLRDCTSTRPRRRDWVHLLAAYRIPHTVQVLHNRFKRCYARACCWRKGALAGTALIANKIAAWEIVRANQRPSRPHNPEGRWFRRHSPRFLASARQPYGTVSASCNTQPARSKQQHHFKGSCCPPPTPPPKPGMQAPVAALTASEALAKSASTAAQGSGSRAGRGQLDRRRSRWAQAGFISASVPPHATDRNRIQTLLLSDLHQLSCPPRAMVTLTVRGVR
jgi:hypothetical protein